MSTVMLLYKQVVALSRNEHKNLKLSPLKDFSFAANTHWVPVAGIEFYRAAKYYPIVFAGEGEALAPILLLGLKANQNDFVESNMQWRKDVYLPAFIRRYPFVLANTNTESKDLTVCVDMACPALNREEGRELFKDDGTNGEILDNFMKLLQEFTAEMERTKQFVAELKERDLLIRRNADIRSMEGATFKVQDFVAVNEEKFGKLSGADLESLHKKGFLGWIFAHLMSLNSLTNLFDMHRERQDEKPQVLN